MAYVAARGGERAIEQAERLHRKEVGAITRDRIEEIDRGLPYLVDRVMGEASLYSRELACLALAQCGGDLYEAVLALRAYKTTQGQIAYAEPIDQNDCIVVRRVSAAFKDIPGGQVLGPTLDYSHRLLKTEVLESGRFDPEPVSAAETPSPAQAPVLADWQRAQGLLAAATPDPRRGGDIPDLTRQPMSFPAPRAHRLQALARADTGGTLALGYSTMRGYGITHPTVNEVRLAHAEVVLRHPRGFSYSAGRIKVSQAEVVMGSYAEANPTLETGFAATMGWNEVKVIAAASLDLAANAGNPHAASTEEFVLYHTEPVESSGFCLHFKLPHYVSFQSTLDAMRDVRTPTAPAHAAAEPETEPA